MIWRISLAGAAWANDESALITARPETPLQKVSEFAPIPAVFVPGLGSFHVDAATLPAGPFLASDRAGKLSAIRTSAHA